MRAIVFIFFLFLTACSPVPDEPGVVTKDIAVTVKYADLDTINARAREYGYASQANGFYHSASNTIWCPAPPNPAHEPPDAATARAFQTCGHELYHVVSGAFH